MNFIKEGVRSSAEATLAVVAIGWGIEYEGFGSRRRPAWKPTAGALSRSMRTSGRPQQTFLPPVM
jgi:hypothetical protein